MSGAGFRARADLAPGPCDDESACMFARVSMCFAFCLPLVSFLVDWRFFRKRVGCLSCVRWHPHVQPLPGSCMCCTHVSRAPTYPPQMPTGKDTDEVAYSTVYEVCAAPHTTAQGELGT